MRMVTALLFLAVSHACFAQALSKDEAVALAEKFVTENGYTNLPAEKMKSPVDKESIEWFDATGQTMQMRFNSLRSKSIGVREVIDGDRKRWFVAFDYVDRSRAEGMCRVVTMNLDGAKIRMEHKSGERKFLVGFRDE